MKRLRDRAAGRQTARQGGLAVLACAVAGAVLQLGGCFEPLDMKLHDLAWRAGPVFREADAPGGILTVVVDQGSLEHVYRHQGMRWPWPRLYHALMIEFLHDAGARAIVFDIFFTEPDIDRLDITAAESDEALRAATAAAGNVVHAAVPQREGLPPEPDRLAALERHLARRPIHHAGPAVPRHATALLPAPGLIDAALAVGSVTIETDRDNVMRRMRPVQVLDGRLVPTLPVAVAAALVGADAIALAPGRLTIGEHGFQLAADGTFYPRWYRAPRDAGATVFPRLSAADVLTSRIRQLHGQEPLIEPESIRDRIVLIGSTAPGLMDIKASPLNHATPGMDLHATLLANLVRGEGVRRHGTGTALVLLALTCLLAGLAAGGGHRQILGLLAVGLLLAGLLSGGYLMLTRRLVFMPIAAPLFGAAASFFAVTAINHAAARRQTRLVRGIFEHYLDRAVVRELIRHPERVRLGGERRVCTVLFADVVDFTALSERLSPEALVGVMNRYFEAMTEIIIAVGGFVDKFIGDAIVAVFGAPGETDDHALRACGAAIEMTRRLASMQTDFRTDGCTGELAVRIGVATGPVVIGNMGSATRMNYTAMGDTMNLGARLEGANTFYGTRILIAESTAQAVGDGVLLREIDTVRVKGRRAGVRVFEVLVTHADTPDAGMSDRHARYAAGLAHYRAGRWHEAATAFDALAAAGDCPASTMATRCAALAANPPPDWDGVTELLAK